MVTVIFSDSAKDDLRDIKNFISRNSLEFADLLLAKIFELAENLKIFPKMGRKVPELNEESMRELIIQNYRIIYRILEENIEIVSIIHGSRKLKIG